MASQSTIDRSFGIIPGVSLFGRAWRITVDTLQMEKIDCEFHVKKTIKAEPNTCDLKIYNLTADHRKQIEQSPSVKDTMKVPVIIEAGYGTTLAQIYKGDLRAGWTVNSGPEVVTELNTGDGEKGMANARLNIPVGPGTPIAQVIGQIVDVLGLGQGNVGKIAAQLASSGSSMFSKKGQVLKGNAADHLTDLCKSVGLEWSVQDGAVQLLTLGQPLDGQAVKLTSNTGLIGSPTVDSKGVLKATMLLVPGIVPGGKVQMEGLHVKGTYKITVVESIGDTLGNDWYHKIEGEKVA